LHTLLSTYSRFRIRNVGSSRTRTPKGPPRQRVRRPSSCCFLHRRSSILASRMNDEQQSFGMPFPGSGWRGLTRLTRQRLQLYLVFHGRSTVFDLPIYSKVSLTRISRRAHQLLGQQAYTISRRVSRFSQGQHSDLL